MTDTKVVWGNDPENTLTQIRVARRNDPNVARMAPIADRAVANGLRDHWPDPADRETAGFGILMGAATAAAAVSDGWNAGLVNFMALLGQGLVDDARTETRGAHD
jgi:hypothetical protein